MAFRAQEPVLDSNWKPEDENVWGQALSCKNYPGFHMFCFKREQAGSCVQKKFWLQPLVSLILVLMN